MEVNLLATFSDRYTMEKTAEVLRSQGVLDIKFNNGGEPHAHYPADSFVQSVDSIATEPSFELTVSVEKSRYRQAEDTIIKYGGQLH
ncbi:hypothetical protein SAMN04487897_11642 [Paenibacillus sp. yr247]|uniref:hypothetical protein n=1 Tax=Paenibacillus sp. yr247 TaxID=1761880 RepID=UPI0008819555|nr:hypothetical protein [Paenibacillus sp. yr247]SDO53267.1 hypothetical protein SAMN04487897_11642 [Paenibacillus sp. yr247]